MGRLMLMGLALTVLAACSDDDDTGTGPDPVPQATVFTATGNITAKVEEFRAVLGAPNGGTAG